MGSDKQGKFCHDADEHQDLKAAMRSKNFILFALKLKSADYGNKIYFLLILNKSVQCQSRVN